jgi:hypothetical protein
MKCLIYGVMPQVEVCNFARCTVAWQIQEKHVGSVPERVLAHRAHFSTTDTGRMSAKACPINRRYSIQKCGSTSSLGSCTIKRREH